MSEQEVDYAIILTDHFLSNSNLREIGRKIKNGQRVELGYYFSPLWKKFIWLALKYLGVTALTKDFFANVEIRTLDSRGKSKIMTLPNPTKKIHLNEAKRSESFSLHFVALSASTCQWKFVKSCGAGLTGF